MLLNLPAPDLLRVHHWPTSVVGRAIARAFTPPPEMEIWQWADENVLLQNEDAAEPGEYRSAKTPWTKRLQEIIRRPEMWVWNFAEAKYIRVPVTEVNVQKSSQSGYSEAALNGIRWRASYRPCNVIYAIDSADEARKIARRLLRSFKFLDQSIFTGDPDDIKSLEFQLRGMELLFYGSFSTGKFANKQSPFTISDEVEEHGKFILDDLASRKKTSTGGLQINLSKPKLKGGPINRAFTRGNQEEYFVPCPHCGHEQFLTFFPEERDVAFSEDFVWVNTETGENCCTPGPPPIPSGFRSAAVYLAATNEIFEAPTHCQAYEKLTTDAASEAVSGFVRADGSFVEYDSALSRDSAKFLRLPLPLPLGQTRKLKTGRFVFEHCKNLLGRWDKLRVATETYYECAACQGRIEDHHKRGMIDRGRWYPTVFDSAPGILSQHMSDFYSEEEMNSFGQIANEYLDRRDQPPDARTGENPLQFFYNHRCGKTWSEEGTVVATGDILLNRAGVPLWFVDAPNENGHMKRNIFTDVKSAERLSAAVATRGIEAPVLHSACPPYKRGEIPFPLAKWKGKIPTLFVGADVGGNYARWVAVAAHQNFDDVAVIDWGEELDPDSIRYLAVNKSWPMRMNPAEKVRVFTVWIDARWRPRDVYQACIQSRGQMIPTKGLGGAAAVTVKLWNYVHVPGYHDNFYELHYNDQRAKDHFYLDRLKRLRRRLWFPVDVEDDPHFMEELCAEHQKQDRRGRWYWPDESTGPNHYGDSLKEALLGFDFMARQKRTTG